MQSNEILTLDKIVDTSISEYEVNNKCLEVFFNDIKNKEYSDFELINIHMVPAMHNYGSKLRASMQDKLEKAIQKGRGGWWHKNCSSELLRGLLEEHYGKENPGNDFDICNFVMFIYFKEMKS